MANLVGKWNLEKRENFEEFLKTLEIPDAAKGFMANAKPTITISKEDDIWSVLTSIAADKSREIKFKDGVEFDEDFHGRKTKNVVNIEGANKLTHQIFNPDTKALMMTVTKELVNGKMIQTDTHKGVSAVMTFGK